MIRFRDALGVARVRRVPVLERPVSAGFPSPADDFLEDGIDLHRLLVQNRAATFLVRVSGDSMEGKQIFDGDIAVVDRSLRPRDGDVVVVDVDGARSFKVFRRGASDIVLSHANPRLAPFRMPRDALVEVWGVVAASVNPRRRS